MLYVRRKYGENELWQHKYKNGFLSIKYSDEIMLYTCTQQSASTYSTMFHNVGKKDMAKNIIYLYDNGQTRDQSESDEKHYV